MKNTLSRSGWFHSEATHVHQEVRISSIQRVGSRVDTLILNVRYSDNKDQPVKQELASYGASLVVVLRCISLPGGSSWLINWWLVVIKIWMISKCCLMSWAAEIANRHK